MSIDAELNPTYYFTSSIPSNNESRTVILRKQNYGDNFGIYVGQDVPYGLYVVTVDPHSPAAKANVRPGDRVLTINGQSVSNIKGNAKQALINLAAQVQSISLEIQSTNLFENLDIPLNYSSVESAPSAPTFQPLNPLGPIISEEPNFSTDVSSPVKVENRINGDLERYIKSLFAGEDIEILPMNKNSASSNEFMLTRKGQRPKSQTYEPVSDNSSSYEMRERKSRPKRRVSLRNIETQTSFSNLPSILSKQRELSTPPPPPPLPVHPFPKGERSPPSPFKKFTPAGTTKSNSTAPSILTKRSETSLSNDTNISEEIPQRRQLPSSNQIPEVIITEASPSLSRTVSRGRNSTQASTVVEDKKDTALPKKDDQPKEPSQVASLKQEENTSKINRQPPGYEDHSFELVSKVRGGGVRQVHIERDPNFVGYGFSVQYNKLYYLIKNVEPNSPSSHGDLRVNDIIHYINNQSTENMPHSTFVQTVSSSERLDLIAQNFDAYRQANPRVPSDRGQPNNNASSRAMMPIESRETKRKSKIQQLFSRIKGH